MWIIAVVCVLFLTLDKLPQLAEYLKGLI
jgi:Sec-independent protein translocase protein TatA